MTFFLRVYFFFFFFNWASLDVLTFLYDDREGIIVDRNHRPTSIFWFTRFQVRAHRKYYLLVTFLARLKRLVNDETNHDGKLSWHNCEKSTGLTLASFPRIVFSSFRRASQIILSIYLNGWKLSPFLDEYSFNEYREFSFSFLSRWRVQRVRIKLKLILIGKREESFELLVFMIWFVK